MDKSADAFRTISEVADDMNIPTHVLRFWETKFNQIKPLKRGGGRRYYRPDDVSLLKGIRHLLYDQGYTIKGVQKFLKEHGARFVHDIGKNGGIIPSMEPMVSQNNEVQSVAVAENMGLEPIPEVVSPELSEISDQLVGLAKAPKARRLFGLGASGKDSTSGEKMAKDDRDLLQEALYDLLECKRLLDQVR